MQELACSAGRGVAPAVVRRGRRNPCRNVAVTIAAAPAQNVRRVFTAPSVYNFRRHLEILAMLAPGFDQRAKVVDELGGRVISDMRGAGERFMVARATRGDRPGQAGRGRAPALLEIGVNPHDAGRAAARWKAGDVKAASAGGDVNGLDKRCRARRLPVDAYHLGLLNRLVQVIPL